MAYYSACSTVRRIVTHLFTDSENIIIMRSSTSAPESLSEDVRYLVPFILPTYINAL